MKTKVLSYENRARFFWTMAILCVASFFVYMYAMNATARHIAERQELERQIADMRADLDSLEFAYIELKNNVTIETAYQYGFKEEKSPLFVSRSSASSLSLNTQAR